MSTNKHSTFKRFLTLPIQFDSLWSFVILAGVLGVMNIWPIIPNDYWFHLAYGRDILSLHAIPWNDTYTFTMTGEAYPALGVYWLGEVWMYLIHNFAAGWQSSIYGLVIFLAYFLVYKAAVRRAGNVYASGLALIVGILLGFTNWNIRPQLFAYLYLAVMLYCDVAISTTPTFKRKIAWLAGSVIALLLWQNTHGTFLFAYMLVGATVLNNFKGNTRNGLVILLAVLPLLSPLGIEMPAYFMRMLGQNMAARNIIEWQPAYITEITGQIFYPLLVMILLLGFKKPKLTWLEWIIFAIFLILSLRYRRAILFWGIYITPLVAVELSKFDYFQRERSTNKYGKALNTAVVITVSVLVVLTYPPMKKILPFPEDRKQSFGFNTPIAAVEYLRQNLAPGNVFANYSFSGYITYESFAEYKTFMDTRFDLFSDPVFDDYVVIHNAKDGWLDAASKYPIDYWLISKDGQMKLDTALRGLETVALVYEDDEYSLFSTIDP